MGESSNLIVDHIKNFEYRAQRKLDAYSSTYTHTYYGLRIDNFNNIEDFCAYFDIHITSFTGDVLEYDVIGLNLAVANAFRRIMISEENDLATFDKLVKAHFL